MKLKPIEQISRVETVANRIRSLIEDGTLSPGERMPSEPEMAERLGVSRAVLREAIGQLKSVGLLDVQHGRGTFVGSGKSLAASAQLLRTALAFSPRDLKTVAEFRCALELEAVRRAAQRCSDEDITELRKLCDEMDSTDANSLESMRADFKFHLKIVAICQNPLMTNVMEVLYEFVVGGMVQTVKPPAQGMRGQGHKKIVDAIATRDPAIAEAAMRKHMNLLEERLTEAETVPADASLIPIEEKPARRKSTRNA
jgi:GntR family transcriptional repressor for pyruvate dehydrogenase complex